ncbi:cytochrome C [Bathymodiolus thermophilus thioautotrophic gill symbiont]|uniref:Cytochrome C n=1 Tax=Bathymodiolus thermophilus thioautotrophic gill symbiont TaxID=2360 RepID=A0A3G3IJ56_9GAMM|nr:cytochrome C [Bathymodiolus thermophilus thioautotrophic gill symbiont]
MQKSLNASSPFTSVSSLFFYGIIFSFFIGKTMKLFITVLIAILSTSCMYNETKTNDANKISAAEKQKLSKEAIGLVKQLGGALKPELKKVIKTKGLEHAVEFCAVRAPEITKKINQENKDWTIKRVSLKNRNPNAKPDSWEKKVLQMFDKRQSNGESAKKMAYSEVVDGEFRFMKAQGVGMPCLSCHSKKIAKNIKSAIDKHYPNDKATGYSLGQIRGAFSLSKKL